MGNWSRHFVSLISPTGARNGAGFNPCQGLYYAPTGSAPKTALIATHYNVDFSEHYLGEFMAARGYGFLGWNTRFRGAEAYFLLEHALIDIGAGVRWLKEEAGAEQVVILGNSGGGSLMGAYQSQALGVTMEPTPGLSLPDAIHDLIPAELYISLCAHLGRPEVLTDWFDPSVTNETDPTSIDPTLNMYAPENGPPYSPEFVTRYRAAQKDRNDRITDWCHSELARLAGLGMFDRAFNLYRTWADLRLMDGTLDPSEREVGRCYAGDPKAANFSPRGIGLTNTLRTWLSMWSLKDSHCRGAPHLNRITQPALVVQSSGDTGVFPSDAKAIFEALGSDDKHLEMIPGDHYLQSPADARDGVADMITDWLRARS
ncbi:MAG: alpha/beta hydrolase [Pseudomonadales bacterium]|nr:alpha/beta hydrolase [Pseudomonadales bacterium]NIX06751.1 alpha/beta hydrolase [Pseudomonadales bacterium]